MDEVEVTDDPLSSEIAAVNTSSSQPWRWYHVAGLLFFFWHGLAILSAARPYQLLYPQPPGDSGYAVLARLERAAQASNGTFWPLETYMELVGVDQQWNTFAPVPPEIYSTHSVLADFDGKSRPVWGDGLKLDRAGVGLFYDPVVKMVGGLRSRPVQDLVLRSLARRLQKVGQKPQSLTLQVSYVKMDIDAKGHLLKTGPTELQLRTLWITP